MKKILTFALSLTFAFPLVASASFFTVTPFSGSYTTGDTITLSIAVNPSGSTVYTAMLDARFSPDTFEVVSFSLNDSMLPLKQSGYDALNNSTGVITKTGGYTGGISSVTPFGTLVLRTKGSGTGTFTISDGSKLLDSNNTDQQSGSQNIVFSIIAKVPVVEKPVVAQKTTAPKKTETVSPKKTESITETPEVVVDNKPIAVATSSTQVAAVVGSGATNITMLWVLGLIASLCVFGLGYFTGKRRAY